MRFQHLWREVVEGAAHGVAPIIRRMDGPAEIADFDLAVQAHKNILGLDVAVDDVFIVQELQRTRHLRDVLRRQGFGETLRFPQVFV